MHVRCKKRGHCGFVGEGVSHTGIGVTRLPGGRNRKSHLHTLPLLDNTSPVFTTEEFIFRTHFPTKVYLWTGNMRMNVHSTCHDRLARCINGLCL